MLTCFQEAVTTLVASPSAPNFGYVNCDDEPLLCGAWIAPTASIYYFLLPEPKPNQSPASTPIYWVPLNLTTVTADDIVKISQHTTYLQTGSRWDSALHPIDGWVAQYGLLEPLAYFLHYLAKIPSWMFTIGISLFGRQLM